MKAKVFLGLGLAIICAVGLAWGSQETPEEETPFAAIEPRSASEDEPYINVGFYGSLTGEASVLGQMGQLGCRLAVDQINNEGGIHGKKIRFIEYDDQSNPVFAEEVVRKMVTEDRVDAIVGSHTSGNISRTAPVTEQAQVLQIGLGTSFIWTNQGYKYLFRATGNSALYDEALFQAIREGNHDKIAVYYGSTKYASAGAKNLMEHIKGEPEMQVVWARSHDISQTEFLNDFKSMLNTEPDAVVLYASSENAGTQMQELRDVAGYTGMIYAPEAFAASTTRQEAGESLRGLVYTCTKTIPESPASAISERERAFLESFIKMYGTMPVADTAYRGYDAMMLLAEAFRSTASMESEDLRQAILEISGYEGVNGVYDFSDGSGDGLEICQVVTVTDSGHVQIQEYPRNR